MFSLFKTQDTSIPKVKLSEYFIKVQKGIIKRDH
jgi:transcriptional repressor NF-X1